MPPETEFTLSCPTPLPDGGVVQMAHGGGGRLMQRLIDQIIAPAFRNPFLEARHDSAVLPFGNGTEMRLAFTTDSYVVRPLFFPGGNIGTLAINGTVNDLAMSGGRPLWISVGFILEEGLPLDTLRRIVEAMQQAADTAGVQIVTGDTKVVDRGKGDGIFVNTAGIGRVEHNLLISPVSVAAGDAILLSGDIGRHGITIMAERDGLDFESAIASDCAPLAAPVMALLAGGIEVHCLRDLTRGGLASGLVEIAEASGRRLQVIEERIPVREDVRAACELLGLDPLSVANEGRFIAFVPASQAEAALAMLREHSVSSDAQQIGVVTESRESIVVVSSRIGTGRIVDMLSGEQLPRIC